jgi:hypothetical protein
LTNLYLYVTLARVASTVNSKVNANGGRDPRQPDGVDAWLPGPGAAG